MPSPRSPNAPLRATLFGIVMLVAVLLLGMTMIAGRMSAGGFSSVSPPGWRIRYQVPADWRLDEGVDSSGALGALVYVAPTKDRLLCVTRLRVLADTTAESLCQEILTGHAQAVGLPLPSELAPEPAPFGDWSGAAVSWTPHVGDGGRAFRLFVAGGVADRGSAHKDAYTLEMQCVESADARDNAVWREVLNSIKTLPET